MLIATPYSAIPQLGRDLSGLLAVPIAGDDTQPVQVAAAYAYRQDFFVALLTHAPCLAPEGSAD